MFNSLFEEKKEMLSKQKDSDSEEDQPKQKVVCSPPPTSQRVPIFPGLNPSALIVSALRVPVSIIYYLKDKGGIQIK